MEKLIVFGGTFDPVHNGHLRLAYAASMRFGAEVVFVPNRAPRWKKPEARAEDRLAMLKAALKEQGSPGLSMDLFEYKSEAEVNYTIDTVRYFARKYPNRQLFLLIGADQVDSFDKWKDAEELAKIATPLYVSRPDFEIDEANVNRFKMVRLSYDKAGEVSSSKVRELHSLDIPNSVISYIEEHGLYYIAKLKEYLSDKRLSHSISVAKTAFEIAKRNDIHEPARAYIAGLLHDMGKELPIDKQRAIVGEYYPDYLDMPGWAYHQFVGAHLAKSDFAIGDDEIIDAISFHATGKKHMTPLGKIIYAADKIEPTRGYDSRPLIRKCIKNYYVGFVAVLEENMAFLSQKGQNMNSNRLTRECVEMYLGVDR